ncbi:hypothetical protein KHA94_20495 [Bacillus sp. FJAT-49705]|uniref:ABC-2 type transport system permease protein n=1 Tax=Cytobacillus citreus TaxID=2833586 RepID=A0ABS5NXL1_9BACI|nr:hypothetical protein [Cytobacillus citreus]MBS4192526.1 hypothetical protein [Cytobacillus citreus]
MSEWKQACWLAMFEVKSSLKGIITLAAMALGLPLFFTELISFSVLEDAPIVYDFFFVFIFWTVAASLRPKEIQLKKMSGDSWVSPYFIMLNQLPIKKNVLVMSRFISYFSISIPFHALFLTIYYALSPELREVMPNASYIVFSIIWICFGIMSGSIFPASDVGEKLSTWKIVVFNIFFFGAIIAIFLGFYFVYGQGIVAGTIHAANEWPLLSIAVSILIAVMGFLYSKGYIYKKIDKVDYLV